MSDINISNLQVPPTTTMPAHVASANPHPQYALVGDIASIAKVSIAVSNLADVNVVEPQSANTVLIYDGNNYNPIDMTTLGTLIQIPMATSNNAGIIRVASTMFELDSCAATPKLVVDYVNNTIAASAYGYATTVTSGVVRLATANDIVSSDQSAVVTASVLNDVVSSNLYTLSAATMYSLGGVKIIDTECDAGRSKVADLITSIHSVNWPVGATGNADWIASYCPSIKYGQFVNVLITTADSSQLPYYKTYPDIISEDVIAETLHRSNYSNLILRYSVFSNGVLSGRISYDTSVLTTTIRNNTVIVVAENGAAYDINTYGKIYIAQEGNIKRWTIGSDCFGFIEGIAHNVHISATSAVWGANAWVYNHGHVEYATVEGTGQLLCGSVPEDQPDDAVVENVTVCNGLSKYAGLQIFEHGKGYNIVLVNNASAYIYGYAKDVIVHSGCCLFVKDTVKDSVVTATAKIDNLILYTGATLFVDDGATINGCILHPGVIINPQYPKATIHYDTCRETEHPVCIVTKRDIHYYHDEEKNSDYTVNYYTYKDTSGNITASTAVLPQQVAFLEPSGTSLVHHPVSGDSWDGYTVSNRIYVWAIDMPRGLYRSDVFAENEYKAIATSGITSANAYAYTSYFQAAYKFYDLQVASYGKTGIGLTNYYALQVTSTVVDELTTSSERYKAKVVF